LISACSRADRDGFALTGCAGDDIYGDGVNIAARLEPLVDPGGICVSCIVNESIGNRVDVQFQDAGDITVKNIERLIRI
jgi:adenylate cyclase